MANRGRLAQLLALGSSLFAIGTAHAGGVYLSSFGGPGMGTASAGENAIAQDASTAFHNPAGMTLLDDHQIQGGLAPGFSIIEFDADSNTPSGGSDGGDQGGFIPISGIHYVHKVHDRVRFGLSVGALAGVVLDPSNSWAGRNQLTYLNLFSASLIPTAAVRVTDWLSIGGGVIATYANLDLHVRAPVGRQPSIELRSLDDLATAPLGGILIHPVDNFRFGVTYNGETQLRLKGPLRIPVGIGAPGIELTFRLAQAIRSSVYWEPNETISLMLSGGWEDWSVAESIPLSVGAGSSSIPLAFRDTWYLAGGAEYQLNESWRLKLGARYDTSALQDGDRTVAFPIDRVWTLGAGVTHHYSEKLDISLSFVWNDLGESSVNNNFVTGQYKKNHVFLFGISLAWKQLPWSGRLSF